MLRGYIARMPPRRQKGSHDFASSATAAASAAATAASTAAAAAVTASNAAAAVAAAVGYDDSDSDESDDEFNEIGDVVESERLDIAGFMQTAQQDRLMPTTRRGYQGFLRQMALWASGVDEFKSFVSAEGHIKTPLDRNAMVGFTEHLKNRKVNWPHHAVPGTMKHLAPKTICNFFAAAKDTYAHHGQPFPVEIDTYFSNFYRAYILFISREKDLGTYPDRTNSTGFSFGVYERICRKASAYYQSGRGACVTSWRYVWLFFIFLFNLMGRRERISRLRFSWIWWQDDSMMVKVPTQKGDQEGSLSYWKRLYAHPDQPWLCPVTALAVEVFSITPADAFRDHIFPYNGQAYHRHFRNFMHWAFPEEGMLEGVPIDRITPHSPKRSAICLVSGCEVVKWDAAELRADHKVGLTSVYQSCAAPQQDGIMGRLLAGMIIGSDSFNVAPPHFRQEIVAGIPFHALVAHYNCYNAQFQTVIPFLLASIVFHLKSGQLSTMLPAIHPFWSSTLYCRYKNLIQQLNGQILGGIIGTESVLKVTGNSVIGDIHRHVAVIRPEVTAIRADVAEIRALISARSGPIVTAGVSTSSRIHCDNHILVELMEDVRRIRQKIEVQGTQIQSAIPAFRAVLPHRCVPVFYLANSFVLASYTPFNLLTRWLTPEPPAPALRHITNEMLPRVEGRRKQENLLSTYHQFMQALLGCNPDFQYIDMDLQMVFEVAWARMTQICGWGKDCLPERSVKTVYGWLLKTPDMLRQLKDTKVSFVEKQIEEAGNRTLEAQQQLLQLNGRRNATTTSTGPSAENAVQGVAAVMLEVRQQIQERRDTTVAASLAAAAASDALVATPACVPRGALLYASDAPRPLPALRAGECKRQEHHDYDAYIVVHAPQVGAQPCWPCPFCLTSTTPGAFQSTKLGLAKHLTTRHSAENKYDGARFTCMENATSCALVWCNRRYAIAGQSFHPVVAST